MFVPTPSPVKMEVIRIPTTVVDVNVRRDWAVNSVNAMSLESQVKHTMAGKSDCRFNLVQAYFIQKKRIGQDEMS